MIKELEKMRIKNLRYTNTVFGFTMALTFTTLVGSVLLDTSTVEAKDVVSVEAIKVDDVDSTLYQNNEYFYQIENLFEEDIEEYKYSGMKLSHELEDEVKRLADIYGIDYRIVLAIGERESGGNWNNNGVISFSNDYGVFQINECNLEYIKEKLGYSMNDILNDPVKNAEACIYLLKNIIDRDDVKTVDEVFGMYNGWIGWENKPLAVSYSSGCCEILNNYFPDFEYKNNSSYSN